MNSSSVWFKCYAPAPAARVRLFCFPHAGGSALSFREWGAHLPGVEIVCVQPPGREERIMETPPRSVTQAVAPLLAALGPWLDRPFAFFGHSLGTLHAYELARQLRERGAPGPTRLFVSAHRAPHLRPSRRLLHSLSDADFVAELRKIGGTPALVLDTPELLELVLPTIRADLESTERYEWQPGPPLDCPFVAFGGVSDARVDRPEIEAWRDHTSATFSSHFFPGGHFYLHEHAPTLLRLVRQSLPESAVAGP